MAARSEVVAELVSIWNIQETLLQYYRTIFITAQAVVFAIAATIAVSSSPWVAFFLMVLGIVMMKIWTGVCHNRARDVSFVQLLLIREERGEGGDLAASPLTSLKRFQSSGNTADKKLRAEIEADTEYQQMLGSVSRVRMDKQLPNLFWVLWGVLFIYIMFASCRSLHPSTEQTKVVSSAVAPDSACCQQVRPCLGEGVPAHNTRGHVARRCVRPACALSTRLGGRALKK
jgi:hypothetical protein